MASRHTRELGRDRKNIGRFIQLPWEVSLEASVCSLGKVPVRRCSMTDYKSDSPDWDPGSKQGLVRDRFCR